MDIQRLIAKVAETSTPLLCKQRLNAVAEIRRAHGADAAQLRQAIDQELTRRLGAPRDGWSTGAQGEPRYLRAEGETVAVVYRIETHGKDRGGYGIEVGGEFLEGFPREVDDARDLAEAHLGSLE